jgi:hypothetical protein
MWFFVVFLYHCENESAARISYVTGSHEVRLHG